jgi:hypothetical protein
VTAGVRPVFRFAESVSVSKIFLFCFFCRSIEPAQIRRRQGSRYPFESAVFGSFNEQPHQLSGKEKRSAPRAA